MRILAKHHYVHFTFETRHDLEFWVKSCVVNNTNSSVLDGAGVDPKLFYPSRTPRSNLKTKVIFASRLLKSKGLESFLLMARDLADHPDLQFIVAGIADDEDPDAIRPEDLAKIREIQFLGQIEDMPPLLRECDIVCLPTTYGEGIPRILIEAAATGLASIVSDHPGCREVVEDGITGRVLSGTSNIELSHEMSAAVVNYVNDPDLLNKHKQAAYRHFRSRKFSEDISVAEFTKLLGIASRSSDLPDGARADHSVELSARI